MRSDWHPKICQDLQFMKIFKMIRGFFLNWSRSSKIMQNVVFRFKLWSLILINGLKNWTEKSYCLIMEESTSLLFNLPARVLKWKNFAINIRMNRWPKIK